MLTLAIVPLLVAVPVFAQPMNMVGLQSTTSTNGTTL